MEELISVIVPIYNVEKYLVTCLDSILNQIYKNLEIILIDDGSSDNCPEICDEYAKRDCRIKVIHQKNRGLSAARNRGLDVAKGQFISFVDSDDYIHEKMLKTLHQNMIENKADLAVCGYSKISDFSESRSIIRNKDVLCSTGIEAMNNLYRHFELDVFGWEAWNKLYRAEIFKKLRYPIGKICEDEFLIHYILDNVKLVSYTTEKLYYYRIRENSIMNETYNIKRLDDLEAIEDRMKFLKRKGYKEPYIKTIEYYLDILKVHYYLSKKHLEDDISFFLLKKFEDFYRNLDTNVKLSTKTKVKSEVFLLSPSFYRGTVKLLKGKENGA